MSDAIWYYVDRNQQRNGPVTAQAVAEAFGYGWVDDQSLIWREGLGAWTALAGHRAELGIVGPPTVTLAPAAYPEPPRGMSKKMGCLLIGVVLLVVSVPVMAILAAIALPAYQDYIARSQVTSGLADIRGGVTAFEEAITRQSASPASPADIGLPDSTNRCGAIYVAGETTDDSGQTISCTLLGNPKVAGAVVSLTRDAYGSWACTVTQVEPKYLPRGCESY